MKALSSSCVFSRSRTEWRREGKHQIWKIKACYFRENTRNKEHFFVKIFTVCELLNLPTNISTSETYYKHFNLIVPTETASPVLLFDPNIFQIPDRINVSRKWFSDFLPLSIQFLTRRERRRRNSHRNDEGEKWLGNEFETLWRNPSNLGEKWARRISPSNFDSVSRTKVSSQTSGIQRCWN